MTTLKNDYINRAQQAQGLTLNDYMSQAQQAQGLTLLGMGNTINPHNTTAAMNAQMHAQNQRMQQEQLRMKEGPCTTHFSIRKIENGYILETSSKQYFVEDRVAAGDQLVVLLTKGELENGHD